MKLVVVADDFGLCQSVNEGIIDATINGIVCEPSLMLGSPGTDHALALARENQLDAIGIHMVLKHWDSTGKLWHKTDYYDFFEQASESEVVQLVEQELALFERVVGKKPSHITSQYSVAAHPKALPAVIDYARRYGIPMRHPSTKFTGALGTGRDQDAVSAIRSAGVRTTDQFLIHVDVESTESLYQLVTDELSRNRSDAVIELGLHPGYVSDELRALSSLVDGREVDTAFATSPQVQTWLDEHNVQLVGYGDI